MQGLQFLSPSVLATIMIASAGFLLVCGLALPRLHKEALQRRLAKVAIEHGGTQVLAGKTPTNSRKRQAKSSLLQRLVIEPISNTAQGNHDKIALKLRQAGYRSNSAVQTYLAVRVLSPVFLGLFVTFYGVIVLEKDATPVNLLAMLGGGGFLGYLLPPMMVSNRAQKRQTSIQRAWPDALDLLLICVEAGYGIDAALIRLSEEIGMQSPELAEEISITALELSYLQDRAKALDNFADRTGLEQVRHVVGSLKQTERYGTDLGRALRVHAQESRDLRLEKAKQKAASLPPKLTVPMILFFLPILFVILIAPAVIQIVNG